MGGEECTGPRHRATMPRRTLLLSLALVAAVLGLVACGGDDEPDTGGEAASSGETEVRKVRTTVVPGIGSVPFRIAMQKGLFKKRNLEIEVTEGIDVPTYVASLDRQFDVVMTVTSLALQSAGAGRPTVSFAGMEALSEDIPTNPIVTKDPSIKSYADLAGKSLGVVLVGGAIEAQLDYVLKPQGLSTEDIKFQTVPFPNQLDQLRAGRVDAIHSAVGFFEPLLDEGYHMAGQLPQDALRRAGAKFPLVYAHFVTSAQYAKEHSDVLRDFQAAIAEADEWATAHRDESLEIFAEWVGRDPNTVKTIKMPEFKPEVSASDFEPWIPIFEEGGLLKRDVDPASLVAEVPTN